jgi:uncharacterized protein (UPF0261 family)
VQKRLLIIATLDTKGKEADYVRQRVQERGITSVVMDVGTLDGPLTKPDITSSEVAEAAGHNLDMLRATGGRTSAVRAMQEGGAILAQKLLADGTIGGVFGMGGGTGTAIVTSIMRSLPFGVPKVVVSTVASRDVREYVGTKDIALFHSVADLLGFNEFIRVILGQAAFAVCGMMEHGSELKKGRPMVAVSAYGINSACALHAEGFLAQKDYDMIGFHANGCGGMAMEELIGEGVITGVLDFTPHEIADDLYGGYCRGIGPDRFETAGRMGIPLVLVPGGLDNAVFSPFYPMPDILKGRRTHAHDSRFCVRMESGEMEMFAHMIGERLNKSIGPAFVLIPTRGWSEADKEGMALFDPQVDRVFTTTLKQILKPEIPIEEMEVHISEPDFAKRAVEILHSMIELQRLRVTNKR